MSVPAATFQQSNCCACSRQKLADFVAEVG
jgi:hypothetical protein